MNGSNLEQYIGKTISMYVKKNFENRMIQLEILEASVKKYYSIIMCMNCDCAVIDQKLTVVCSAIGCINVICCDTKNCFLKIPCEACAEYSCLKGKCMNDMCPCNWQFCPEHTKYCNTCNAILCWLHNGCNDTHDYCAKCILLKIKKQKI